jgi:protein arginine kinase activator
MSERPLECGECKRKAQIIYKEIVGEQITTTEMCEECPVLKVKLHGDKLASNKKESSLCCGRCGTNLESVLTGQSLGCSECYVVFEGFIIKELIAADGIPSFLKNKEKSQTLHLGRGPRQAGSLALSSKLASLHEALNEALKKENYEQAAYLRDQIKSITEKS